MRHNDRSYGGVQCPLVAFHPHGSAQTLKPGSKHVRLKLLQAAHAADHVLAMVTTHYMTLHEEAKNLKWKRTLQLSGSVMSVEDVGDATAAGPSL